MTNKRLKQTWAEEQEAVGAQERQLDLELDLSSLNVACEEEK